MSHQHSILPYSFANALLKCHSIGSELTQFGYETIHLKVEKFGENSNYLSNLWTNISGIKQIV